MEGAIGTLLVILVPAAVGVFHWHLRWAVAGSVVMGAWVFWKGYVQNLSPDRHRIRAVAIAPLSFFVGALPFALVSSLVFGLTLWLTHGKFKF